MILFKDRSSAGLALGSALSKEAPSNTVLVALPRGGVPVARKMHEQGGWPWDIWIVRKLRHPDNPEHILGALAEDDTPLWNQAALQRFHVYPEEIDLWEVRQEIRSLRQRFSGKNVVPDVSGKTVVIVDDGVATGWSARAAARSIKDHGATSIWGAFPVCRTGNIDELDQTICLYHPKEFHRIDLFYENFPVPSDREIVHELEQP